jgi:molybdenum cofactor biosynthesis enzyme MoaA
MHYIALKGDDISLIEYESPFFCTECDASSECHDGNWKFRLVRFHDLDLPGALRKIIEKFKKVMPAAAVIRYFQIENRLGLLRKLEISGKIPMAITDMKIDKKTAPKKAERLTPKTEEKK